MPIIKSAKKRVRTAQKANVRNVKTRRTLKRALKQLIKKVDSQSRRQAQSATDRAVKKGIIHKNKAARIKKQLAAKAKAAGVKPTAAKATVKKATTPKKAPAAKSAKKTVSKKRVSTKK